MTSGYQNPQDLCRLQARDLVLGVLREGANYAQGIETRVEVLTGVRPSQSGIYCALHSLKREHLVEQSHSGPATTEDGEEVRGGRPRIYYALTGLGWVEADVVWKQTMQFYRVRSSPEESR